MSPIVHTGVALLSWQKSMEEENKNLITLLLFILVSNLPDIDFMFYFIIGKKAFTIHQYYTHNIFFAGIIPLLFFPILKQKAERTGLYLAAYSHLLLDLFTIDGTPPFGFRLFYPLSDRLFHFGFFPNLHKKTLEEVFSLHNLWVLLFETAVCLLPIIFYYRKEFLSYLKQEKFRGFKWQR